LTFAGASNREVANHILQREGALDLREDLKETRGAVRNNRGAMSESNAMNEIEVQ
jgi:hypothetical protein